MRTVLPVADTLAMVNYIRRLPTRGSTVKTTRLVDTLCTYKQIRRASLGTRYKSPRGRLFYLVYKRREALGAQVYEHCKTPLVGRTIAIPDLFLSRQTLNDI